MHPIMMMLCAAGVALAYYWFFIPSWRVSDKELLLARVDPFIDNLGEGKYSLVITEAENTKKYHCFSSLQGPIISIKFYRKYVEASFVSDDGKNSGVIEAFIAFDGTPYIREKGRKIRITEEFLSSLTIKQGEREIKFSLKISS